MQPRRMGFFLLCVLVVGSLLFGCGGGGGGGAGSAANLNGPGTPGAGSGGTNTTGSPGNPGTTVSGGGTSQPTSVPVAQVKVAPAAPSIEVGKTIVFSAEAQDNSGAPVAVPVGNWTWTSGNGGVALLIANGDHVTVTGIAPGTATISAQEGMSKTLGSATLTVTPASSGTGGATGKVVYSNDFQNGAGTQWSDTRTTVTPGTPRRAPTRFLGQFGHETVSLTLKSLPAHTNVTVEFDLFIIQSMDGNATAGGVGPDIWDLSVDGGPTLLHTTFSNINSALALGNFVEGYFQAYPGSYPGGEYPYQTGAQEVNTLGYNWDVQIDDSVYHLKYTFPHSGDSVKLNFSGMQNEPVGNEGWGLKNVTVSVQ